MTINALLREYGFPSLVGEPSRNKCVSPITTSPLQLAVETLATTFDNQMTAMWTRGGGADRSICNSCAESRDRT